MSRFLVDVNLPSRLSIFSGSNYEHVVDLNRRMTDIEIWQYARDNELVIVSKDADFSDRISLSEPPPRVVHICIGNMRLRDLYSCLADQWPTVTDLIADFKLVRVFSDRIEAVAD